MPLDETLYGLYKSEVKDYKILFSTISGSHLYGTSTPDSDLDIRGVALSPVLSLIGISSFDQLEKRQPLDLTIYSLKKYALLALDANPNIIELLFAPVEGPTCIEVDKRWLRIVEIRDAFLSKKIAKTYIGYAESQLRDIVRRKDWLGGKVPEDPNPFDYGGVPDKLARIRRVASAIYTLVKGVPILRNRFLSIKYGDIAWTSVEGRNAYQNAKAKRENYESWLRTRNDKRRRLEETFGYDTKNALHLARLILQGLDLLRHKSMVLPSPHAQELLQIKNGKYTYAQLIEWSERGKEEVNQALISTSLPQAPNRKAVEAAVSDINLEYLKSI